MSNKARVIFEYEDGDTEECQYPCSFKDVHRNGERPFHARIIGNKSIELYNDIELALHPIHGSYYHIGHKG